MQVESRWCIAVSAIFGCLLGAGAQPPSGPAAGNKAEPPAAISEAAPGYEGIVFTEIPVARVNDARPHAGVIRSAYGEGGRLVLLSPDGSTRVLTTGFDSAADPAVSFDGKRILFAAKRSAADAWDIFEMNADGSGVRQVTRGMGSCRRPLYQAAIFYLNDPAPVFQVSFVSDIAGEANEEGATIAANLYSVRLDGSSLRRLTYGVSASYDPFQMQDGRLLFSNWQNQQGRVDLFAVHLDGADFSAFSGPQGRRLKHMACTTPKRMAVFVESDKFPWDGAGSLGVLSLRRNLHSYRAVTVPSDGLFVFPSPLPDGSILVSRRPADGSGAHAIFRLSLESGRRTPVYSQPGVHCIQAVALAKRPEPDGHSSVVEDDQSWSKLYGLSVYENDLKPEWMPAGSAARIRVLEGLPRTGATAGTAKRDSLSGLTQKRLLGEVALQDDGSFHLLVPPNIPIQLQVVDRDGLALRTSAWIWTKNKENRGCIGCHEDNERTPENKFAKALGSPAASLMLPPERRRTVDFERDVQPILSSKCANAACHGGAHAPRLGPSSGGQAFSASYRDLLTPAPVARNGRGKYVDPGRARTSPLVWAISGKKTARPWDPASPALTIEPMPPQGSVPLTDEERRIIFEWIDLGAQFSGKPSGGAPAETVISGGRK